MKREELAVKMGAMMTAEVYDSFYSILGNKDTLSSCRRGLSHVKDDREISFKAEGTLLISYLTRQLYPMFVCPAPLRIRPPVSKTWLAGACELTQRHIAQGHLLRGSSRPASNRRLSKTHYVRLS